MRTFIFLFEELEPILDYDTGLTTQPCYQAEGTNLDAAVARLATYGATLGSDWSDDPAAYRDDIAAGRIRVLFPVRT